MKVTSTTDIASQPSDERKDNTVRLLGKNSLKEGAVWSICPIQERLNHRISRF
jgi:hypothetical protein